MIEIIKDKFIKKNGNLYKLIINDKKTKEVITINPFSTEHYNDIDLFNLRIYCDKNNIKLRVLSTMNYLTVNSQYADELILVENKDHMQKAYDSTDNVTTLNSSFFNTKIWIGYFETRFYQIGKNPLERDCYDKTGIIKKIYNEVDIKELNNFILNKKVFIRESSFEAFKNLKLPENIFIAEIKPTFKNLIKTLRKKNVFGLDYCFQREILEKTKHHYMAVQILSSINLDWKIIGAGGSARLFSMLPTKNILLMARDLYGNDEKIKPKKMGWIKKENFPWLGNQINKNWTIDDVDLETIFTQPPQPSWL